jgi:hypothetical protein
MQKAHLIEALYLVTYGSTLATLEHARANVNLRFFGDMQASEQKDATHFERRENKSGAEESVL